MGQALPYVTGNTVTQSVVAAGARDWPHGTASALDLDNPSARIRYRSTGVLSLVGTRIIANTTIGNSFVDLRKNGASSGAGLTIGAGLTGDFADLVNTVSVASGDGFSYVITGGGPPASGGLTLQGVRSVFTPTGDTVSRCTCSGNADVGSGTTYFPLWGCANNNALSHPEATIQVKVPVAGTARNLLLRLDQNTTTGTTTVRFRKNNTDTALVLTAGAGLTGVFEDLTNSEPVAANDLLNYVVEGGGGVGRNLSVSTLCVDYETASMLSIAGGSVSAAFTFPLNFQPAQYQAFQGRYDETGVEAEAQLILGIQTFVRGLGTLVVTNTLNGPGHLRLRINGVDAVSHVLIPAGLTGHFIDETGSDMIEATDAVNFAGTSDATAGLLIANTFYYAMGAEETPPPPECPGLVVGIRIDGVAAPYPPSLCPGGSGTLGSPNVGV